MYFVCTCFSLLRFNQQGLSAIRRFKIKLHNKQQELKVHKDYSTAGSRYISVSSKSKSWLKEIMYILH